MGNIQHQSMASTSPALLSHRRIKGWYEEVKEASLSKEQALQLQASVQSKFQVNTVVQATTPPLTQTLVGIHEVIFSSLCTVGMAGGDWSQEGDC